jgi:uncharacterized membrane protein YgdD (TMEM256/DUF423 family)
MRVDQKFWQSMAGLNGFLAVVMGAIAAHAIDGVQAAAMAEKASIYQLIHAVVLLGLADKDNKILVISRWMFLLGIIFFCGSLYLRSFLGWDAAIKVAPLGGVSFMLGWILIFLFPFKKK